jgi:membrane fusion protein, multidrug efflux system
MIVRFKQPEQFAMPETNGRDSEIVGPPTPSKPPEAFGRGEDPKPKQDADQKAQDGSNQPGKEKKEPEKKPFWKRPVLLSVMIGVALVLTVVGTLYMVHSSHFVSTDDAFVDGRIAHIAPRVAGKVISLSVDDNQIVSADQPLLVIDPQPYEVKLHEAQASQEQSEAQLQQANANLEVAKANADQSDADVVVAQANSLNAKQDFERYTKVEPAARSQLQFDAATANNRSSDAQVTAAQKKADSMRAMVSAAEKTRDAAAAGVDSAKAQVEQAKLDLSYTTVVAGHPGRVTRRTVEVGNFVSVGQEVMDVVGTGVPQDIWVTANFKETQLVKMEKGQPVTISIDAFPEDNLRGHVDSIQDGSGAVFSLLPAENATGNYVKVVQRVPVKIVFDEQPRHMLSPGMSVEPEVDVRNHDQGGDGTNFNAENSPAHQ